MATDGESDLSLMIEQQTSPSVNIDPERARFPYCIVWTPLPVLSWFVPFIGHIGICREDGVILDFAGPNFVCVDNFAFGAPTRYLPISKAQCYLISNADGSGDKVTWDAALHKSIQEFQHQSYNLLTCNCHSFVANVLNRLRFQAGGWNLVNLAILILFNGRWVRKASILQTCVPFLFVFGLGVTFGGTTFLTYLAIFASVLVGWFILGTYCFKQIVVDFTASWCGPCRFIAPFLAELAKKLPNVTFLKVDVDELKSVAQDWAIAAMPTFMFLKDGKIIDKVVGAKKEELQQTIAKHVATASA